MTSHRFARSNLRAGQTPLENFPALAEGGNRAVLHDGNLVRYAQDPDPVGDDDDSGIGRLHPFNSVEQHALAERVQAGVRLVENHEVRVAEERPCKAEALAKPAWKIGASANQDRIVRLRQPNDGLVKAGQLCCFNDLLQIGVVQPGNDVLYRFSEEIDILRQISEAPAAAQIAHDRNVDAIEQDRAGRRSGDSRDDLAKRGFAGAGWTDNAKAFTRR